MRNFIFFSFAALLTVGAIAPSVLADAEIPSPPDGFVLDTADVLSAETEASLESTLSILNSENSSQIVVVTIPTLNDYPIEKYALELGRSWGVGQEEFNNGVVFLVVPDDQEARIEVGYGLEGAITDAQSFAILNQVAIPYFKDGDYDQGVLQSVYHLNLLARGESFELSTEESAELDLGAIIWIGLMFGIPIFWSALSWFSGSKAWWAGGIFGGILGWIVISSFVGLAAGAIAGLFLDFVLSKYFFGKIKRPRGGGFFGGGGGGGGFGGFGGGSFGGGGASGRW